MNDKISGDVKKRQVNPVEVLASHFVTKAYGLIGFPKFLDGHYLYLITKKKKVGTLLKENVYQVEEVVLEMILNKEISCLNQLGSLKNDEIRYSFYEMRFMLNMQMNFCCLFEDQFWLLNLYVCVLSYCVMKCYFG